MDGHGGCLSRIYRQHRARGARHYQCVCEWSSGTGVNSGLRHHVGFLALVVISNTQIPWFRETLGRVLTNSVL